MQAEGRDLTRRRSTRVASALSRRPVAAALLVGLLLAGCSGAPFTQNYHRGYIVPEGALEQIPLGASQEQVLIVLGTPSTVATVSGEAFYYISQRAERSVSFMPTTITDQRVIAIYFDRNRRVQRLAAYGIKDGRVFDFISRTTPTAGTDYNIITGLMHTLENSRMGVPGM